MSKTRLQVRAGVLSIPAHALDDSERTSLLELLLPLTSSHYYGLNSEGLRTLVPTLDKTAQH